MSSNSDREKLLDDQENDVKTKAKGGFSSFLGCLYMVLFIIFVTFILLVVGFVLQEKTNFGKFGTTKLLNDVTNDSSEYYIGLGRYDVTGPIAQVNMMGYAYPAQTAHGLHMRLYARTFIVRDLQNTTSVVFVTVDSGMGAQIVKLEVIKKLREKYGNRYTERNVVISGTHSHSGPAGFFQFLLFEVTSLGFIKETTDAFVDGIAHSIDNAHNNIRRGRLSLATGEVNDANINRSPSAYEHNTPEERSKYKYNTEHGITGLQFSDMSYRPIGLFTWYPVHGTSMNESNELISSDNRGRASALYEKMMRKSGELGGREEFIAAFAAANLGDVSPNTNGPKCIDTGEECDYEQSTCGSPPTVKNCIAFGPGKDMIESTDIIGKRQFEAMRNIIKNGTKPVHGKVGFAHQYVDMTQQNVTLADGTNATTCKPAMGYSFAAGTTDGPGALDFKQSMTEGTPLWDGVRDIIGKIVCKKQPTQEYYNCHKPKPVLLPTGYMDIPYAWHPSVVDVQLLQVGQLMIAAVPGEFTTMAGRRLKDAIKREASKHGMGTDTEVVIAGLSNVYTHYITTLEEFGAQRYEGGSTIFGPHSHAAYVQKFVTLTDAVLTEKNVPPGPPPDNLLTQQIELLPKPLVDAVPEGKQFGDVITDVKSSYQPGGSVLVKFYGANPRNNMRLNETYLEVQRMTSSSKWTVEFTDAVWETRLAWESKAEVHAEKRAKDFLSGMLKFIEKITGFLVEHEKVKELLESKNKLLTSFKYSDVQSLLELGVISRPKPKLSVFDEPVVTDESRVTIQWDIPTGQQPGTYRILYFGDRLNADGTLTPFTGQSGQFTVQM